MASTCLTRLLLRAVQLGNDPGGVRRCVFFRRRAQRESGVVRGLRQGVVQLGQATADRGRHDGISLQGGLEFLRAVAAQQGGAQGAFQEIPRPRPGVAFVGDECVQHRKRMRHAVGIHPQHLAQQRGNVRVAGAVSGWPVRR
ncbi:hypothetical protein G6F68_017527 [Rhizopus microsporus]|nr:hypothetical protein G6F68_017527 [Rhizopus microsporus]